MTQNNLVSVIIPCYNGESYVGQAVSSALEQTYPNVEVTVIDDGSTDRSEEVVRRMLGDGRLQLLAQQNAGLSSARNTGLRASRGRYVAFLDADDYWDRDFVEKLLGALTKADAGLSYCGWQNVGLPGPRGQPFVPPDYESDPDKIAKLIESTRWPVHAVLVRRELVDRAGGFDPRWSPCEDFGLWLRVATRTRLARVPEVLAFYRHHGSGQLSRQLARTAIKHWRAQMEFLRERPDIRRALGRSRLRQLTHGYLLRRGYSCFWRRELSAAHSIFRTVLRTGYFRWGDLKYLVPAILPYPVYRNLLHQRDRIHRRT